MIYSCPHCRTQNFATKARLRTARLVPLQCWKCGREIKKLRQTCIKKRGSAKK